MDPQPSFSSPNNFSTLMDPHPLFSSPNSQVSGSDSTHPSSLCPHGPSISSANVANFIPTKLDWLPGADTNYKTWRKQMLCLIRSQGLMHYIDGSTSLPLPPNQDYRIWERNNALVQGWILGSISYEISSIVLELESAQAVWSTLESTFGRSLGKADEQKKCVNDSTPLYRAALDGDWAVANQIFTTNSAAKTDWVDSTKITTPLHVAVAAGKKAIGFVRNFLNALQDGEELNAIKNATKATALHIAAAVGNKEAATLLVKRSPALWKMQNTYGHFPIHVAALYKQREVLEYLIEHTKDVGHLQPVNPFDGLQGQNLLTYLIQAEYFDIALRLAKDHNELLRVASPDNDLDSPLTLLTIKMKTLSTTNFNFWERFVSSWIVPLGTASRSHSTSNRSDIEILQQDSQGIFKKCLEGLVPRLREVREKMRLDQQAQQLLKCMCKAIGSQNFNLVDEIFYEAVFVAAELGVSEVVRVVVDTFPGAIYTVNKLSRQHIFHKAIENRSADVFNLIYEISDHKFFMTSWKDNYGNNPLHSVGKLAPSNKLNEISGAALQMQREMQWYKEVEKIVHPYSREQKNKAGKTPIMLFTEEHKGLKDAGEKWMKETANSFSFVAVLISTVMFTGTITVPGGNESGTGFPMFYKEPAFIAFAVSDAASLFASATSLLLFLSILTSRYAEEDFLYSLPTKLMCGLATLFLSVISMMISFSITLFIVFGQKKRWVLFPLLIFACMPVASFVLFQFPLLSDLIVSTYGRGIFGKKGQHRSY